MTITEKLRKLDMFGYAVEMHYKGSSVYQTLFGSVITIMTYTLILVNALSIGGDFISNKN